MLDDRSPLWEAAACTQYGMPDMWHGDSETANQGDTAKAIAICQRCVIRTDCFRIRLHTRTQRNLRGDNHQTTQTDARRQTKSRSAMTLGELIAALEAVDPELVLPYGFRHPHSYRGYYDELAFEPAKDVSIAEMLKDARSALGATYQGWKGGDYTMDKWTPCWLSMEGDANHETIGPTLLRFMIAAGKKNV